MQARTYDVFDTVLTRRVGDPASVFLLAGRKAIEAGLVSCTPEVFARSRLLAEASARAESETRLPTHDRIIEHLTVLLELPRTSIEPLIDLEFEVERSLLVAVPGVLDHITAQRAAGATIAFVSDMYLPSAFIRSVLEHHGLCTADDRVFVSAEEGRSKRRGDLFPVVLAELGVAASDMVHVGDDARADVAQPRAHGITARRWTGAVPNRYEIALESHRWESDGASSVLAGSSRLARLEHPVDTSHDTAIRDVTAGVAAPMLTAYVLWVLRRARSLGLDTLHFISRDGEVLLRIAQRLDERLGLGFDLRYIYGSRQAWYPAGVDPGEPIAALAGLRHSSDEGLHPLLERCGVDPDRWIGSDDTDQHVLDRLCRDQAFLADVTSGLSGRQDRLEQYLRTTGLFDTDRAGIVDVGWHGRALDHLSVMFTRVGAHVPVGFYMSLVGPGAASLRQPNEVWLRGMGRMLRTRFIMVETFCAGTHGQVVDYEPGGSAPVLRSALNTGATEWGLGLLRGTIDSFVDRSAECLAALPPDVNLRQATLQTFDLFYDAPTRLEATVWGRFPFEAGPSGAVTEYLAPPRGLKDHVADRIGERAKLRWAPGDAALAPSAWVAAVDAADWLRRRRRTM